MSDFPSGLCGCCEDCGILSIGCFCPWYLVAKNWSDVNGWECGCCDCIMPVPEFWHRQILRRHFKLDESRCTDCITCYLCLPLAICQDARNIKILKESNSNISTFN
jgi:Cys-rich protein (TIGR01571 family)